MVRLFSVFLLLFLSSFTQAQNIKISASVDSTDYLVGDYINFNIEVIHKQNIDVVKPELPDSIKFIELISKSEHHKIEDENSVDNFTFVLSVYDSARVTIPPVPINYKAKSDSAYLTILTDSISFSVHSLKISESEDIKDVKSPLTIPFDWKTFLLWLIILIVLVVSGIIIYKKYFRKGKEEKEEIKIKLPPHRVALNALNNLEEKKLWQKGMVKEYHSEITEIIRKYFEERFDLPAMELTSSESIDLLKKHPDAKAIIEITRQFFTNADLVKFAKFIPMDSVNEEMMKQAHQIVNTTKQPDVIENKESENV